MNTWENSLYNSIDMNWLTVNHLLANFLLHQELYFFTFLLQTKMGDCRLPGTGVNLFRYVVPFPEGKSHFVLLPRAKLAKSKTQSSRE